MGDFVTRLIAGLVGSKLLKGGGLYGGLYRGALWGLLRGILGV